MFRRDIFFVVRIIIIILRQECTLLHDLNHVVCLHFCHDEFVEANFVLVQPLAKFGEQPIEHQMKSDCSVWIVPCAPFIFPKSPSSNLMSNNSDGLVYGTGLMTRPSLFSRLVQSALFVIVYLFGYTVVAGSSSTLASFSLFAQGSTAPKTKSGLIVAFLFLCCCLRAAGLLRFGSVVK